MEQLRSVRGTAETAVTEDMTAAHLGSGDVPVFATPMVVLMAERAAVDALKGKLPEGSTSVGGAVRLTHDAPTPVGATVKATATLEEIRGRRLRFAVTVADEAGPVAQGFHIRVVVDRQRFEQSIADRRARPH